MAAAGVSLTFVGTASAADGQTSYLVTTTRPSAVGQIRRAGFRIDHAIAGGDVVTVIGEAGAMAELEAIDGVESAAPNARFEVELPEPVAVHEDTDDVGTTQADPMFLENQWDKFVTGTLDAHAHATGAGSLVAIIDTGIDPAHPDLADNIVAMEFFTSLDALDPDPFDYDGHGTNVAGIAAASGAVGVIGTAPEADIASLKVFHIVEDEEGNLVLATTTQDILDAIDHAADIGADAANLSLGTLPIPPEGNRGGLRVAYERTIQHATRQGTLVAASAGNSAANLQHGGFLTLPNSVAGATSISATAPDDGLSYYSNFGTGEIDAGAPGGGYDNLVDTLVGFQEWAEAGSPPLISLDPREEGEPGTLWLDANGVPTTDAGAIADTEQHPMPAWPVPFNFVFNAVTGGSYAWFAGTSMAAPQVTGLVALIRELDPDANARQVEQAIKQSADGAGGQGDPQFGAGRINVLAAVESVID